jgi:hypothetical protein
MATGWYKSKPSRPGDMKIAEAYLAEAVEAMASESRWFVKEWQAVRLLQRELIIYIYRCSLKLLFHGSPPCSNTPKETNCCSMYVYICHYYSIYPLNPYSMLFVNVCYISQLLSPIHTNDTGYLISKHHMGSGNRIYLVYLQR